MTTSSYNIKGCRFYCAECFADIEAECICDVGYDAETGYPLVDMTDEEWAYLYHESPSDVQRQETSESTPLSLHDINFLQELGGSDMGKVTQWEMAEMYGISVNEIEKLIKSEQVN